MYGLCMFREVADDALALLGEAVLLSPPDASLYLARTEAHSRRRQLVEAHGKVTLQLKGVVS